eukprot:COSAG02_NODE_47207_length_343_cov_0.336066_1_plen_60_part_10
MLGVLCECGWAARGGEGGALGRNGVVGRRRETRFGNVTGDAAGGLREDREVVMQAVSQDG